MTELVKAERPESVDGSTVKTMTGCGSLYVTLGEVEGKLFEAFAKLGKAGGCGAAQTEAISRLISLALRFGVPPGEVVKQMKGISCHQGGPGCAKSCADAMGLVMERDIARHEEATSKQPEANGFEIVEDNEQEAETIGVRILHFVNTEGKTLCGKIQFPPHPDVKNIECTDCLAIREKSNAVFEEAEDGG